LGVSRNERLLALFTGRGGLAVGMAYKPHRLEPNYPGPEVVTSPSPAPPVVVECWCGMVERMSLKTLDRFTRDTWKRFDPGDLEPLKWAIIRRRRVLAMQLRP